MNRSNLHAGLGGPNDAQFPDPGTGVALPSSRDVTIGLIIAASASETNTLADPPAAGITLTLVARTVGSSGTRVVTVASAYDIIGHTTLTFAAAGDYCVLRSVPVGSAFKWRSAGVNGGSGGILARNEINTADTTVGAATLSAAGIVGGVITRSGSTADYTDTTDTATAIIAALPSGAPIGSSWELTIKNTVAFTETLAGGTGVTLSGLTVVPPLSVGRFLVTYSAASTVTMVGLSSSLLVSVPPSKYTTAAYQSASFAAGDITGAGVTNFNNTGVTPGSLTVRTGTQMFADIPNCQVGFSYQLNVRNSSTAANTLTIASAAGVLLTGTMTVAQNVTRTFNVTFTSATGCTITNMGPGAAAA